MKAKSPSHEAIQLLGGVKKLTKNDVLKTDVFLGWVRSSCGLDSGELAEKLLIHLLNQSAPRACRFQIIF